MKKPMLFTALALFGLTLAVSAGDPAQPASDPQVASAQEGKKDEKPAPKEEPKKDEKAPVAELGKPAPEFSLTDLNGKTVKLSDYKGKIVVLEWFSPACPMCVWAYSETGPLRELPERLKKDGIVWLAINSSNPDNDGSKVDLNKKFMEDNKSKVTVLLDPTGVTGKAYAAKTTPHMYIIDEKGVLRYRGALDNAPNGRVPDKEFKVNYVQKAIDELKSGKAITTAETKSYG